MGKARLAALAATIACLLVAPVPAQEAEPAPAGQAGSGSGSVTSTAEPDSRFEIEKTENGYLRLDRSTGAMSLCTRRDGQLICRMAADERSALMDEISRLAREVESARGEIARLEDRLGGEQAVPGAGEAYPGVEGKPSDDGAAQGSRPGTSGEGQDDAAQRDDLDRALDYSTRMLRRFFEMVREFRDGVEQEE